ncbi:MAG: cation-translocating P-type ATPase [Anaerolineae bacterium]|nr:cation-translocating P-type ATPase [Anaerolineae bacterium]
MSTQVLEIPITGMDCAECTHHVQRALADLPGVASVQVFLSTEKAVVRLEPDARLDWADLRRAVEAAGYGVGAEVTTPAVGMEDFNRRLTVLLAAVFAVVLSVAIVGEGLGFFDRLNALVPLPLGVVLVLIGGLPVFRNVARAALRRQITSHTLMTVGAIAALLVGEWVAAVIVVLFMRVGDAVERFTTAGARRAVQELTAMMPRLARVERDGVEHEVPVTDVRVGETVIVRPGEHIPVDGEVIGGQATVDQAAITGESMPVEVGPGGHVFVATLVRLGSLRLKTLRVGADTTFGRVIRMVTEAEAHRGEVQRLADRFSGYYLPLVVGIAALTFLFSRNALAAAAVLVVACSCSFALATPVAMLASIGAAAKRGLLIKGGKYIETLVRADVVLVDKTGTLTLGRPEITDVVPLNGMTPADVLALAAAAERYSEHPLAEAVRAAARRQGLTPPAPETFEAVPGLGVRAQVNGHRVVVGNRRLLPGMADLPTAQALEAQGKTLLFLARDDEPVAVLAAADTLRPEVPAALAELRRLGIKRIELLTGDHERVAAPLAERLGVAYRAGLLPEDKIAAVRDYQAQGHIVVMIGDGINDAPALAQADVGVAMGAAGSDIAIEAAHIALMREDWTLVPTVLRLARRTMGVVRTNLLFTAAYNLIGLSLAALGILPPTLAAAAQSLPDIGILANSARLLHVDNKR